jgi:hypothetical protein
MKLLFSFFSFFSLVFAAETNQKVLLEHYRNELKTRLENQYDVEEALNTYNKQLKTVIIQLFETAVSEEEVDCDWSLYCVGSTGKGVATPNSDLEFGILISGGNGANRQKFEKISHRFKALSSSAGISFDLGWFPLLRGLKIHKTFVTTPKQLKEIRDSSRKNFVSCMLFEQSRFLAGSEQLFDDFDNQAHSLSNHFSMVVNEETHLARGDLSQADSIINSLKTLYMSRLSGKNTTREEFVLRPKVIMYRWVTHLIDCLCMAHNIQEANPFVALRILVSKGFLQPINASRAESCLRLGIWLRCILGDTPSTTQFTTEEIGKIIHTFEDGNFFYKEAAEFFDYTEHG